MITASNLTKRYGEKVAVDDLSFTVKPGVVTGFLGPNGAGKSTTMRMILGLDRPSKGEVKVGGKNYADFSAPLKEVGALLEARSIHTGRSARNHLIALGQTHGIKTKRVDEVISIVGLGEVAKKRAGGFSLGMGQRLGIASALLGDPSVLILDEPVNGLDPEGILWIRNLLKDLAKEGRTIFVSSHLMSEMALTAEHLIIVGRGKLIADTPVSLMLDKASSKVRAVSPDPLLLEKVLKEKKVSFSLQGDTFEISSLSAKDIGALAFENKVPLYELSPLKASLEEAFMDLTSNSVEYHGQTSAKSENSDLLKNSASTDSATNALRKKGGKDV